MTKATYTGVIFHCVVSRADRRKRHRYGTPNPYTGSKSSSRWLISMKRYPENLRPTITTVTAMVTAAICPALFT